MAKNCNFEIADSKVYNGLKKAFGTNETKIFSLYNSVIKNGEFTPEFQEWYKNKYRVKNDITIDKVNPDNIIDRIEEYYNRNVPDGNSSLIKSTENLIGDYNSVADRVFCQRTTANEMLDIFRDWHYVKFNEQPFNRKEYINKARINLLNRLKARIFEKFNMTNEDFIDNISKSHIMELANSYIKLGETKQDAITLGKVAEQIRIIEIIADNNLNNQDKNLLATIKESINSNTNKEGIKYSDVFFDEVFRDSRLSSIRDEIGDEFNTSEEDKAQNSEDVALNQVNDEDVDSNKDTFDISFRVFDSHDGQYTTFMMHVSSSIGMYFNCLRKLQGLGSVNGKPNYDDRNAIGIADTMNANECSMIMYSQGDYTNVDSMIESVERIAQQISGFEAFATFAQDLKANRDFAYEVYRTFGKSVIAKQETYIENGERKTRISNNSSNKREAVLFEYMNSLRSSSINVDYSNSKQELDKINKRLKNISDKLNKGKIYNKNTDKLEDYNTESDTYKTDLTELQAALTENIRKYLPTISESVISNFINKNKIKGEINKIANLNKLEAVLRKIINSSNATYNSYTAKVAEAAEARRHNRALDRIIDEGGTVNPNDRLDASAPWQTDYLHKDSQAAAQELTNLLLPYTTSKIELNSRNAAGNLSSDVINSSMITNLMNIIQSDLNNADNENSPINNYAKYKFRTKQYNLSNILVEQVEDGVIINKGLFRLENGEYVPTDYAQDLIKMTLFNGISDYGSNKSALYAEMSQGDYIATAMVNFFNSHRTSAAIDFADYLMRTPSDAPKNFVYSAPKYSLNYTGPNNRIISFFQIEDERAVNARVRELIGNIKHQDLEEAEGVKDSAQKVNINLGVDLLTGKTINKLSINNKSALATKKNSLEAYLNLNVDGVDFIVKGTLNEDKSAITNVTLSTVITDGTPGVAWGSEIYKALTDHFRNNLIKGKLKMADGSTVQRKINRKHPIYRQMYNQFKQEMINAAVAIDKMFSHTNGIIDCEDVNNTPKFNNDFDQLADKDRSVYDNYHKKKSVYYDKNRVKHEESGIIQNYWRPVYDENGKLLYHEKTNLKRLSGNVFTSDRFTIFDENNQQVRNFLQEVIAEDASDTEDGKIRFLYGGANNSHLHINDDGDIEFTDAQEALINEKLEEFIQAYINSTSERISKFENLLEGIPHNEDDIAEFILNYRLAYFGCNDLFEGDSKFYKSAQDFLKRAKEVQGSGVPYAIVDFNKPMFGQFQQEVNNAYLNSEEMQNWLKSVDPNDTLHNMKQYTTFRGVTVKNTIRTSKESQESLVKKLTENFRRNGLTVKEAEKQAKDMMKGYRNTKVNDAQSYITFEEWIRRVAARGQLHKYKPLIAAILDESKPLSADDIQEFVQVQKNFYYDMNYDETTGVMAPRQIKNAEFVLVPRLIKGTELEQVYNVMAENNIDQLNTEETSKAGKVNVLTLWDNNGNITKEWLPNTKETKEHRKAIVDSAAEIYDYNYLYTQQETPQHINAENKAGIQIIKKIIDNIGDTITVNGKELKGIKQRFLRNYAQNIYDSFDQIMKELNVERDEQGNIKIDEYGNIKGLDYKLFLDRVKDEMMRLGLDSNMLDMVTLDTLHSESKTGDNGQGLQTKVSPYFNSTRKKFESVAQAVFNNYITRQKLPGFHAAQITNIGWKPLNNKVSGHTYSKELKYHPNQYQNEKGKTISWREYENLSDEEKKVYKNIGSAPYIEVMLPASNFGITRNDKEFNGIREKAKTENWTIEQLEEELDKAILAKLQLEGLDTMIGYRIPTEGKQSIAIMKVVGFTSAAYGSTIVVPDDWVSQTGSDFDIDSVYGIQFATYRDKYGISKVEYSENVNKNYINHIMRQLTKEARQELYQKAKLTEEDRKEIFADSENDNSFDRIEKIDSKKESNLLFYVKEYADEHGLTSFEDYSKLDYSEQNSREARNNQILQDMIDILQSDEALEENLSQSQFTHIIDARDNTMSDVDKARRNGRSSYDFIDQAEYQEDAMSGAKLKARSVVLDTLCSVANTTKPILNKPIKIIYKGDFKTLQKRFDVKDINGRYIGLVKDLGNGKIEVSHSMYGHSNDNRNIEGRLLTVYSSETTAHILDAIKEGAIQNVNDLTFGVYKLFPNIGSNYTTAVSFMMQPGISRIVEAYNKNKSIYAKKYENPVDAALKSIAKDLGIATNNTSQKKIDAKVQEMIKGNPKFENVLDSEYLVARIKSDKSLFSSPVEELLFDYMVVKQYEELSNIANKIDAYTRVLNPDKFGAKQTIFATNKVFDDIAEIMADAKPVFARQNDKHFLENVYPGIGLVRNGNIDGFLQYNEEQSTYPPLYSFLKRATATSIKINRTLFLTQQKDFVDAIKRIREVMSGENPRITEDTYNNFEKYVLNHIYAQIGLIASNVSYEYGKGIVETNGNTELERSRIYGYGYNPDTKVRSFITDDKGNKQEVFEEFKPVDINKPTQEEIDKFATLTPAQKVSWIQEHFRNGLICNYLRVNLSNSGQYRKDRAGSQTIEFVEESQDRETMYDEFRKTFQNKNPFLVLTAMDIIKYAFVVEGYNMKKGAINKVIDNDILTNDRGLFGTGIMRSLDAKVKSFANDIDKYTLDTLLENYVRSHSNMTEISHTYLNKKEKAKFKSNAYGLLAIDSNTENQFLIDNGIIYNTTYDGQIYTEANKYIKIKEAGNKEILYKIIPSNNSSMIYLVPLNTLQSFESSVWSANDTNNKYMNIEYYESLLEEYESTYPAYDVKTMHDAAIAKAKANKEQYSKPEHKKVAKDLETVDFDINDNSIPGAVSLKQQIQNHFNGFTGSPLYIENNFLRDHIKAIGAENGLIKQINGNDYLIFKLNTKHLFTYTNEKGLNKEIKAKDKVYEKLIETARTRGITSGHPGQAHLNNVYCIVPITRTVIDDSSIRSSSVTERMTKDINKANKAIRKKAIYEENEAADKYVRQTGEGQVNATTANLENVIISTAEYVTTAIDDIFNGDRGLNLFMKSPTTGSYVSITDPEVIAMLKADPKLNRAYLKTLLDAQHLIRTFESFGTFKFNDDNAHLKHYVEKINEAIKKLRDSDILQEAEELYVTGYLAKISNNPNIKSNIISLLDGYHDTSWMAMQFNDLQDTNNPIIQIITSDVMADVRAKEMQGVERVREFKKHIAEIKAEASRLGLTINWKNIVDEYGRFIQDYNESFINDLETHRTTCDAAYEAYKNTPDTIDGLEKMDAYEKYLKAKLDYDKWKLANVNQQLDDDYYRRNIALRESMINSDTGKFADIYIKHCMLYDKLRDIFSHKDSNGNLDPHWEKEKQNVLDNLRDLRAEAIRLPNGEWSVKRDYEEHELPTNPRLRRILGLQSLSAANRLNKFVQDNNALKDEYYDKTERFGFKETFDKFYQIVQNRERINPNTGRPYYTASENEANEEYVHAKNWIKQNAVFVYDIYKKGEKELSSDEKKQLLNDYYDGNFDQDNDVDFENRVRAALDFFKKTAGSRNNKNAIYKRLARKYDAYDSNGVVDARLFAPEEIAAIKKEQEARYGIGESVQFNERSIIKNATTDDTIYTDAFYKGMQVGGITNVEYLKIVANINNILKECHYSSTGELMTSKLTLEQLNALLDEFKKLGYDSYEQTFNTRNGIKKHLGVTKHKAKEVQKFIAENVDFVLSSEDQARFDREKREAQNKGGAFYQIWQEVNQEWNEEKGMFVPNHLLWGYAKPKDTLPQDVKDKFISKQKTAAIRILNQVFDEKPSKYYELEYDAKAKEFGENSQEFKDWYNANHIYNPHKHCYEPITCWMDSSPNDKMPGTWEPSYKMQDKTPKADKLNPNYRPKLGIAANYKNGSINNYSNNSHLNASERKLKEYVQSVLSGLATTKAAKQYFDRGYLPSRAVAQDNVDGKFWLKELAKGFGYVESNAGYERWDNVVDYDHDYVPEMPMLHQLQNKDSVRKPYREAYDTDSEYEKAKQEFENNKEENKKKNAEIHKSLLDNDWESVIEEFITKAAHYNAIQDNKNKLYFGQKLINDIQVYQTRSSGIKNFRRERNYEEGQEVEYQKAIDNNLQQQYTNWIRRLIFDQYKQAQGNKTRVMQILQGITSTNYMTLNIRGGIANVLVGEANIFNEWFAKEYFGAKEWAVGKTHWMSAMGSFAANMYSETSTSVVDAIIKGMNIVDYDEITGRITQKSLAEWSKRLRDAAFSPQTIGEHFMQNTAMLSMMESHRVVANPQYGEPGEAKYTIMNKTEYLVGSMYDALKEVLSEEQFADYTEFANQIKKDPNKAKEYAWFRRDSISEFVMTRLDAATQKAYLSAEQRIRKEKESEFLSNPTVFSQFKLGEDGKMAFANGSLLEELNTLQENQEVSDAYKLLGKFKGRVISVNKKIHGNYGKLDAAKIENEWWGSLVMQYHKHIPTGIAKRYRRKGYFNEERGTVEKGSYVALYDFLTMPIRTIAKRNNLSEGETEALQGIQNIFTYATDYLHYAKLAWNVMPEYERANIKRAIGDIAGTLVAVAMAILIHCGYDDDDESIPYNLALYEMDRLATETFMWNPLGAYSEAKKLWSSPVAAESIIEDCFNILGTLSGMILEGEEYDPYFRSGRYAGQHKLGVYVERRIPYWRNWVAIRDIADNNHYYKMGDNALSIIPVKDIAHTITGKN